LVVKVLTLFPLAAAFAIGTTGLGFAESPAPGNPNQLLADHVARRLEQQGLSRVADVQIACENGTVTLVGKTTDEASKERVLNETRYTPGVKLVRDGLAVEPQSVTRVQATVPVAPSPIDPNSPLVEPAPLGAPGMQSPDMQGPQLPPYAWPTYAPYNNVSRVAYPQAYPHNAFPFIGPFYPFPKVPLGWRKVVLEWEDGHWFMGRASAPHDYWRVRFW